MVNLATVEDELKRCPELKLEYLTTIREWMKHQPHLPQIDDMQLIFFLRCNQFSIEQTKVNIDNYFTFRTHAPELCIGRSTKNPDVSNILNVLQIAVLPQRDPNGNVVVMQRLVNLEPSKLNMEAVSKVNLMLGEAFMLEKGSIPGVILVLDQTGFTLSHLARVPLSIPKKFFYYGQECANIAVHGIHIINTNNYIDKIVTFMKPFMNKHFQSMLHIHTEGSIEGFYKYVPKEILPEEYGGNAGKMADLHENGRQLIERFNNVFEELDKVVVDESKRIGKKVSASELFGVEGSFKKLDID